MLTLTSACAAAFANRSISIEPILEVSTSVNPGSGTWTTIPPSSLITRPVRSFSPVISKTPVMRLDFEIIPSETIKALLLDKRQIRYSEKIADQVFPRFIGFLEKPQKGWAIKDGVLIETIRVNCYSFSQHLKALDYEKLFIADVDGPSLTTQQISLSYILGVYSEISRRYSGTPDYISANHLFSPNAVGPNGLGGAQIYNFATGATYYAPGDFTVGITGTDFRITWIAGGPATDQEYLFMCPYVVGFVVPKPATYYTTVTPSVPEVGALSNTPFATSGSLLNYGGVEWDIPMIEPGGTAARTFFTKLSAAKSKPRFFLRAGSGTGMGTEHFNSQDFTVDYDNGYIAYTGVEGASGTRRVFSDNQYNAADIMHVGVRELYWPQTSGSNNSLETALQYLYLGINGQISLPASDPSGISLSDYRITGVKGDAALRALLENAPPNYIVYDHTEHDGDGTVRLKSVVQSGTADFTLSQVTALRDKEAPAEVYTMVRVLSLISTDVRPWYGDYANCAANLGDHDVTDWVDYAHIWDKRSSTFATLNTSPSYITLCARPNCQVIERIKSFEVKFEGKLSIFRVRAYHDAQSATGPAETDREYTQPYAVHYAGSGAAQTITIDVSSMSEDGEGGEHPEKFLLEFSNYGAVTCKNYGISVTVDRYVLAVAALADKSPTDGAWYTYDVAPDVADPTYDTFRYWYRYVPQSVLKSWMLRYSSAVSAGNEKTYFWDWKAHRVYTITDVPGLGPDQASELAKTYLDEFYRRATAQEADVLYEPRAEFGDTVAVPDPTAGTYLRTIVGFRDGGTFTEPSLTLELADYSA